MGFGRMQQSVVTFHLPNQKTKQQKKKAKSKAKKAHQKKNAQIYSHCSAIYLKYNLLSICLAFVMNQSEKFLKPQSKETSGCSE